jgi:hypothetical protein
VDQLLKSVSSGVARFVFAWLLPSAITLGLFWVFLLPKIRTAGPVVAVTTHAHSDLGKVVIFFFAVATLSILFAYSSLIIYRILEGYHLPGSLRRLLVQRHIRKWTRLKALDAYEQRTGRTPKGLDRERLASYPDQPEFFMPTLMGNALRTLERFGVTRYGLDSQLLWYELQGVAPATVRLDTEEGRAPVDFFVSAIVHLSALAAASIWIAVVADSGRGGPIILAVVSMVLVPIAYRSAVKNMKEWANSVKALVNLCRIDMASRIGLTVPNEIEGERHMWESYIGAIEYNDDRFLPYYDSYRRVLQPGVNGPSRGSERPIPGDDSR